MNLILQKPFMARAMWFMQLQMDVRATAKQVYGMVVKMAPGDEKEDLRWLVRHVSTRGCDIKIWSSKEDGSESFLTPYLGSCGCGRPC